MDPNACLKNIRTIADRIIRHSQDPNSASAIQELDAVNLAEHIQTLDDWMKTGGFLPDSWKENPNDKPTIQILQAKIEKYKKTLEDVPAISCGCITDISNLVEP